MSTAGIFTLITNDGKQDRMLMATELLKRRLKSVKMSRVAAGLKDTTPTLLDIERTHVLFMNAHFKPFAAIGFEYNKVQPDSGGATLGSKVRFSIPQFGDFFGDMALYVRFNQLTYTPGVAAPNADVFRYCEFPGERLCKNVKFDVNGNPLDEYTRDVYNFNRQFLVQPNKETGYKRLVGQEVCSDAYLQQQTLTAPTSRVKMNFCNGYQTPKPTQAALEVMVPLLFWFNKDCRLAVPSVAIPYGQRFLEIELGTSAELVGKVTPAGADGSDTAVLGSLTIADISLYVNNIFVNPEVHDIFIKRIGFSLIRVHRIQKIRVDKANQSVLLNNMKWPIESLFVAVKPVENETDVSATGYGHYENWHRFGKITEGTAALQGVQGSTLDAAAVLEVAAFDAEAKNAAAATVVLTLDAYRALTYVTQAGMDLLAIAEGASIDGTVAATPAIIDAAVLAAVASGAYDAPTVEGANPTMDTKLCAPTVDKLSVTAHGIDLYKEFPGTLFNAYTPYTYGGHNIRTPEDCAAYMITFCLYPGSYQPSGHVNVSRAREFYLQYWSSIVNTTDQCDLLVVASSINFLLISDGSAVLRYST